MTSKLPRGLLILTGIGFFMGLINPVQGQLTPPSGWIPAPAELAVSNNLSSPSKTLTVETNKWRADFNLFYNGGIYQLFDKVYDPNMADNLVTGPGYSQGGLFDYDVYLVGDQEFMTTLGQNSDPCRTTLEVLENTPVRLRLRQKGHPRLNNGDGPPGNPFPELDMVEFTTDWTIYPTGRVYIKFDAVVADGWTGLVSQGPGGSEKGINASGNTITAVNGTNFMFPWITQGDRIQSSSGGWGPIEITRRVNQSTLQLASSVPSGTNLDFTITRPYILDETFSIHADGDTGPAPHTSYWQGGSDGDVLYNNGTDGDMFRNPTPPVQNDYCYAHWTRAPRKFGSLLVFNEQFTGASYAVFNDLTYGNLSYTQVARRGLRPFAEHHRHFMAQMGTENDNVLPRIKSVAESLLFADDYRHPYAQARAGTLQSGDGISAYGFHVPSGSYYIAADANKVAEIAFDTMRGGSVATAIAYQKPAVLVSGFDVYDLQLIVELSQDNGATFEELPSSWYNITNRAESSQLGGTDKRLFHLLCPVPATATGANKWVIRFSSKVINLTDLAILAQYWLEVGCGYCGGADFTGDGNIDISDLGILTENWLVG